MREITKLNLLRTLRATGAFSFIPEGRTYSPLVTQAVVSFPKVRLVRSPRGMRLLRKPMDNTAFLRKCHHCPRSCQSPFRFGSSSANCPHKPATGSFICGYGVADCSPIFFCKKKQNRNERTVRINGNLPSGSESYQPRCGTICLCSCGIYELFADSQ